MDVSKEISDYEFLQRLINVLARVRQTSWNINQTRLRYPGPEAMNPEELKAITKVYLALGFDLEEAYKEWKELYAEYKKRILDAYLKELEKYNNLALDWLITSWDEVGEEKAKALLEHKKWKKKVQEIIQKMDKYVNG